MARCVLHNELLHDNSQDFSQAKSLPQLKGYLKHSWILPQAVKAGG